MKKIFHKTPQVISTLNGEIVEVKRFWDDRTLSIGMETKSGGKILSIKRDKRAVGNMMAEIGRKGVWTAISAICID